MKSIIKLLIVCSVLIFVLFIWQEWNDWSITKKINAEKVAAFFTAVGSLLTAVTVYLLYKQIQEQIEDRKAASTPDLYPQDQFFTIIQRSGLPQLKRDKKEDIINGLFNVHNIGLGAAKEIQVKWHFQKEILAPLIKRELLSIYTNQKVESDYSFVSPNNLIEIPFPIMYIASLAYFKDGWSEVIWEELFLELMYKDVHDYQCPVKKFKVVTYVGQHYALFKFIRADAIQLKKDSTMISTELTLKK